MPEANRPQNTMVSVVIPTHNRVGTLIPAIKSALAQNYRDIEVIVVDDASTDDTARIMQEKQATNPNLHVIRHSVNKGAAAARNTGIASARGAYIALLDSDDLWVVDKIERQLAYMKETGCDICTSHAVFRALGARDVSERLLPLKADWQRELVQGLGVNAGSTLLARAEVFEKVGLFDDRLKRLEDWDWFIRAMQAGVKFDNVPFNGSIIQVGGPPSVQSVDDSADTLHAKHARAIYEQWGGDMSQRFQAALRLEKAATRLWHKDFLGFTKGWFDAATHHPMLAAQFFWTRVRRVILGDAPRFFRLFSNKGK